MDVTSENGNTGANDDAASGTLDILMTDSYHAPNGPLDPTEVAYKEKLEKIKGILSGETSIQLTIQFLYSHNRSFFALQILSFFTMFAHIFLHVQVRSFNFEIYKAISGNEK